MHRLVILLTGLLFAPSLLAQVDPASQTLPKAAEVEARIKELKAVSEELTPDQAAAVADLESALTGIKEIARLRETLEATQARVAGAPAKVKNLQAQLKAEEPNRVQEPLTIPKDIEGLESAVDAAQAKSAANTATLNELLAEQEQRSQRTGMLPKQIAEARQAFESLEGAPAGAATPTVTEPRQLKAAVNRQRLKIKIDVLESELASYQALSELLALRIDAQKRKKDRAEQAVKELEAALATQRKKIAEEAKKEAAQAIKDFQESQPELARIAQANRALATDQQERTEAIAKAQDSLRDAKAKTEKIEGWARDTRSRIDVAGLNDGIGFILRGHKADLPSINRIQRELSESGERISKAQIDRLEYEKALAEHGSLSAEVEEVLLRASQQRKAGELEEQSLRSSVEKLLKARVSLLERLVKLTKDEIDSYVNLDVARRTLLNSVQSYRDYIDERVLWIRSGPRMWEISYHPEVWQGLAWIVDPAHWHATLDDLWRAIPKAPLSVFWILLAVVVPLALRRQLSRALSESGELARRGSMVRFRPTSIALLSTFLLVIPLPALLLCLSSLLTTGANESSFTHAVGMALQPLAFFSFFVVVLRWLAVPDGLGEAHFKWPKNALSLLRRRLPHFCGLLAPLLFIVALVDSVPSAPADITTVGRVALFGCFVVLLWMVHVFLSPQRGLFSMPPRREHMDWHWRFRRVWYLTGFAAVLALTVMLVFGYQYSVMQIVKRFQATLALTIGLAVIHALNLRAVTLARRKLAIKEAKERREAEDAREDEEEDGRRALAEQDLIDVELMNTQTRQFLRTIIIVGSLVGIWFIWVDMFPALGFFNRVTLWTMSDGTPISLFHVILSGVIFGMTLLAAKNLPGLLEFTLLRRLPIDAGVRYAISTVSRYVIVLIGVLAAFTEIGIGWSKVQWLVAGISVGLGFGLQEIFANFVAGIIILFERPVRIGDMVTVSDTTGHITRIRIRATTITTLDHKELVVPNKEFITDQITNWTLSDSMNRWTIRVGIAYGSNVVQARRLLLKAARDNSVVLDQPRPQAIFMEFGDSALIFDLRVFIAEYAQWPKLMNSLHMSIDRLFREAKIEISFPQRDLHIRSADGLQALVDSRVSMDAAKSEQSVDSEGESQGGVSMKPE